MNYYFAYGSNLDLDDWKQWCVKNNHLASGLVEHCRAFLPGYVTNYSHYSTGRNGGAANLREADFGLNGVYGSLFIVDHESIEILDDKEGYPKHYGRKMVKVIAETGEIIEALTYISVKYSGDEFYNPTDKYHELVVNGLSRRGMPTTDIAKARSNEENTNQGYIIVYGTLKRNNSRESVMTGKYISDGIIFGELYDLGEYPALVDGNNEIMCEIYFSEDLKNDLIKLDRIEGADMTPPYYIRKITPAKYGDDKIIWGHCYFFSQDLTNYPAISNGIW